MKYQAVIFDLDGVICSTDRFHYMAWKQIANKLHIRFDEQINHRLRGVSRMESLEIILEQYDGTLNIEEKQRLADEKNTIYRELLAQMSKKDLDVEVTSISGDQDRLHVVGGTQLSFEGSSRTQRGRSEEKGVGN